MMGVFVSADELTEELLPFVKEQLEGGTMQNVCLGFLDGRVRLHVYPDMSDKETWRDKFLWAMRVLGSSVAMDAVAFVSDTYMAKQMTKSDGSEWEYGELGEAFQDPSSPDRDRVAEALLVNVVDRTGTCSSVSIMYERQQDGTIEFGERIGAAEGDDGQEEGVRLAGPLVEGLRSAMLQEPISKKVEEVVGDLGGAFGLNREEVTAHMACAGVKTVVTQGVAVALGATSETEERIIKKSFENGPFFSAEEI